MTERDTTGRVARIVQLPEGYWQVWVAAGAGSRFACLTTTFDRAWARRIAKRWLK